MSDDDDFMPEMDKLREMDPEFYAFLEENDKQLLDFKVDEDKDESAVTEDAETVTVLSGDKLQAMMKRASEGKCYRSLRGMLAAYRVASRMGGKSEKQSMFRIDDVGVFNTTLEWVLGSVPSLLAHHAGARKQGESVSACKNWKRVKLAAHQFWGESLTLLGQVTNEDTAEFVLSKLGGSLALEFLFPLVKLRPLLLKGVSAIWAKTDSDRVRAAAGNFFKGLAQGLAKEAGKGINRTVALEGVLRRLVHDYSAGLDRNPGKVSTADSVASLLCEIVKMDENAGFRVTMAAVRQLATALSTALTEKIPAAAHTVFSLGFLRSVRVWVRVVGSFDSLKSLVFPITSVILIAIRAKESHAVYLPFVAQLAAEANNLMMLSGQFIPIAASLIKALAVPARRMHDSKPGNAKLPNVETTAKLQESLVKDNKELLAELVKLLIKRLAEHLELLARTPAFREVSFPVLVQLRRLLKQVPSTKPFIKPLIQAAEESASLSASKRQAIKVLPTVLFALPECSAPLKQLIDGAANTQPSKAATVESLVASGKAKILKTVDIKKQAAEEAAGVSKRSLKRRRQNEKKRALHEQKEQKSAKRSKKADADLVPLVISDDDE